MKRTLSLRICLVVNLLMMIYNITWMANNRITAFKTIITIVQLVLIVLISIILIEKGKET